MFSERKDNILGNTLGIYAGYSQDPLVRKVAASGGVVSQILIYLLESGEIDGAVVSKIVSINGKLDTETIIATTEDEIIDHAGSIYVDIPTSRYLQNISLFNGTLAIAGLPCHHRALEGLIKKDKVLAKKIKYRIGLFCGGNVTLGLYRFILKQHNIEEFDVRRISFKRGHIEGDMIVEKSNCEKTSVPFLHFNVYRILKYYSPPKCFQCYDSTSEYSDISVGDIFTKEYRNKKIKHSLIIARTEKGDRLLKSMIQKKAIMADTLKLEWLISRFGKTIGFNKDIKSRRIAGKIFGINIREVKANPFNAAYFLAYVIIMLNYKLFLIGYFKRIPRIFLYFEVLAMKLLIKCG